MLQKIDYIVQYEIASNEILDKLATPLNVAPLI